MPPCSTRATIRPKWNWFRITDTITLEMAGAGAPTAAAAVGTFGEGSAAAIGAMAAVIFGAGAAAYGSVSGFSAIADTSLIQAGRGVV
jgi:hypothetical protein